MPSCNVNINVYQLLYFHLDVGEVLVGECEQQSLQVTGTIFPLGVNNFCGVNTDQHFYIETVSRGEASYVEFSVDTRVAANYKWGLWITQISCDGTRTIQASHCCFSLSVTHVTTNV